MAPSRGLSEAVRQGMYSAAVKYATCALFLTRVVLTRLVLFLFRLGRACGYQNAGTVEFLFDSRDEKYYFIELNVRIVFTKTDV